MIIVLGILLPIAFVSGLVARKPMPEVSSLPAGWVDRKPSPEPVLWTRNDLWPTRLDTVLLGDPAHPDSPAVKLLAKEEIAQPDLLIYWSSTAPAGGDALPTNSFLLGAWDQNDPVPLTLPAVADGQTGVLILYSLADNKIVQVSKPFNPGKPLALP